MEGGVDELVRDVRPVELGGVDVVDAQVDRPAEDGDGPVAVAWRAEHTRSGQLHRPEADAGDGVAGEVGGTSGR